MEYYIGEEQCGCRVYQAYQTRARISYCPKHKAAPAMYEALTHLTNRFKTAAIMSGLSLDYIEGELEESLRSLQGR